VSVSTFASMPCASRNHGPSSSVGSPPTLCAAASAARMPALTAIASTTERPGSLPWKRPERPADRIRASDSACAVCSSLRPLMRAAIAAAPSGAVK
jgi:hypothetical protein